ncbi:MAG: TolC family protein [Aliivibrio sp.]|uniref:TolC family protein n=1 Tax=Aliivibrio sp. TaxID=1872443 RepID=UPI001A614F4F|nr:TolC family protein [Aliivibrio sp.]
MKITKHIFTVSVAALMAVNVTPTFASKQSTASHSAAQASLTHLIELALDNDANRQQYFAQSLAMRQTAIASNTLMDPKLKLGIGGLPVDSFAFDDDPMTNISIGLMQEFGRGSTLDLQQNKAEQQAESMVLQVSIRELDVANSMTKLWLELGYQQQAQRVLIENQRLMEEMERYVQTNYSIGRSEAQDLLNAQLQVSRLDEKLQSNSQMQQRILSQLSEWLSANWLRQQTTLTATPVLEWEKLNRTLSHAIGTEFYALLMSHPMIKMADVQIMTNQTQVAITEESYAPQFGVEVMYGYRQANGMGGAPASDLLSAYLTMDIPLFTNNRQDRNHAAAQYKVVAAKSNKELLLSQMNAKVNALLMDKNNLKQRIERYESTLLTQAQLRTKAVERGYQNNTAQFNDVINAASDELSLQLERWRLLTDLNIANSNLAYLLSAFDYQVTQPQLNHQQNNQ